MAGTRCRFMRVIVFFDLPVGTAEERREYGRFRKFLIRSGFVMMQESVYTKIVLNASAANAVVARVRLARVRQGLIQVLIVTEKQFASIEFITGSARKDVIDSDERLVIL